MLLNIINETKTTYENLSRLGDIDQVLWAVWSDKSDITTTNELIRTAYFYRLADRGDQNKQNNVAYNNDMDLHRLMWAIHSTLTGIRGTVIIKPSVVLSPLFRSIIVDKLANINDRNWALIKGNHDKYFILNPEYSTIFKSNNLDELVECCESNNLKVIHDDDLIYNEANMDLNYKHWTTEDFQGFIDNDESNSTLPLYSNNRKTITSYGTKNLVLHSLYKKDLTPFFDKFENVKTFKTVGELNALLDEFTDDTTWIMGNFLVHPLTFFKLPLREILLIVARVLAVPNSIVWGKVYDTTSSIHSTLKVHTLSKGSTIND